MNADSGGLLIEARGMGAWVGMPGAIFHVKVIRPWGWAWCRPGYRLDRAMLDGMEGVRGGWAIAGKRHARERPRWRIGDEA